MKTFMIIMGVTALVSAQADSTGYFPDQPSCAIPCLTSAVAAAGCELSDIACQCGPTQAAIGSRVGPCLLGDCSGGELGQAIAAGQAVCSSFRAGELSFTSPGTPTPVPSTSSTGSGSASASASATTSTSVVKTHPPTPSSTSSGTATVTETETSTTPRITHTDTIDVSEPTPTGTFTTTEPSSSPSGAAATPGMMGAGVLAGIMGAVALL
ncbi:hypothetical protein GGS20DRAFT_547943 [Poronia punctata]|nr:hypothetical protein GGS20DRAFT_547943 [Poronia punctata]